MKVTFLVENYFPKIGGVPTVIRYLAEGLASQGYDVEVMTCYVAGRPSRERINGVHILRFDIRTNSLHIFSGNLKEYINYFLEENSDVYILECCQSITTDVLLPYLNKVKGLKILHSHGFSGLTLQPFQNKGSLWSTIGNTYNFFYWNYYYKFIVPKYIKHFNVALYLSHVDSSKKYLEEHFQGDLHVLGNSADDIFFADLDKTKNVLGKYTKIKGQGYMISVANYVALKNQLEIIDEYSKSGCFHYDLILIGSKETPYYHAVMKKAEKINERNQGRIHVLLGVERNDIPCILHHAKLYLVGSTIEAFPISLIEAMAQGVPFVSTNVGNAKLLPGGIVVNDMCRMHETMRKILNDSRLWKKLSEDGRQYARNNCRRIQAVEKLNKIICENVSKRD